MSRKICELFVFQRAAMPLEHQHARGGAIGEGRLRDEFRRKMKVKVRDEHGLVGTSVYRIREVLPIRHYECPILEGIPIDLSSASLLQGCQRGNLHPCSRELLA